MNRLRAGIILPPLPMLPNELEQIMADLAQ